MVDHRIYQKEHIMAGRIFAGCLEAQKEIERDLFEMGVEVQPFSMQDKIVVDDKSYLTKELQGYSYCILDFDDRDKLPGLPLEYCKIELLDRVSNKAIENPGHSWQYRKEVWNEFVNKDGKMAYTYHERIFPQLAKIINELIKHPNTRQAIINIHSNLSHDLNSLGGQSRVPCSMYYQFLYRNGALDIYYVMRSCDFITHWPADVWLAIGLLKYVLHCTDLPVGKFFHYIGSLHVYKKDVEDKGIF